MVVVVGAGGGVESISGKEGVKHGLSSLSYPPLSSPLYRLVPHACPVPNLNGTSDGQPRLN